MLGKIFKFFVLCNLIHGVSNLCFLQHFKFCQCECPLKKTDPLKKKIDNTHSEVSNEGADEFNWDQCKQSKFFCGTAMLQHQLPEIAMSLEKSYIQILDNSFLLQQRMEETGNNILKKQNYTQTMVLGAKQQLVNMTKAMTELKKNQERSFEIIISINADLVNLKKNGTMIVEKLTEIEILTKQIIASANQSTTFRVQMLQNLKKNFIKNMQNINIKMTQLELTLKNAAIRTHLEKIIGLRTLIGYFKSYFERPNQTKLKNLHYACSKADTNPYVILKQINDEDVPEIQALTLGDDLQVFKEKEILLKLELEAVEHLLELCFRLDEEVTNDTIQENSKQNREKLGTLFELIQEKNLDLLKHILEEIIPQNFKKMVFPVCCIQENSETCHLQNALFYEFIIESQTWAQFEYIFQLGKKSSNNVDSFLPKISLLKNEIVYNFGISEYGEWLEGNDESASQHCSLTLAWCEKHDNKSSQNALASVKSWILSFLNVTELEKNCTTLLEYKNNIKTVLNNISSGFTGSEIKAFLTMPINTIFNSSTGIVLPFTKTSFYVKKTAVEKGIFDEKFFSQYISPNSISTKISWPYENSTNSLEYCGKKKIGDFISSIIVEEFLFICF